MKFKKGLCISLTVLELFGAGRAAMAGSLPVISISNEAPQPSLSPKDNPVLASFCNDVTNLYMACVDRYHFDEKKLASFILIKNIRELSPEALFALDTYGYLNPHDNIEDMNQMLTAMANEFESALNAYGDSPDKTAALKELDAALTSFLANVVDTNGTDPRYEKDRLIAMGFQPMAKLPIMNPQSAVDVNNIFMNWICTAGLADPNKGELTEQQRADIRHDYPKLIFEYNGVTYDIAFTDLHPLTQAAFLRALTILNYGLSHQGVISEADCQVNNNIIVGAIGTTYQNIAETLSQFDTIENIR